MKGIFRASGSGVATIVLSLSALLSYVVGLLRDKVLALYFGQGTLVDAYNTAFLIPDLLFNIFIAGALTGVFIPVFSEYAVKDKEEAFRVTNIFLTITSLFVVVVSVVTFFLAPYFVPFFFRSAPLETQELIIGLTRVMLLSPFFFGISNTLGSVLLSLKHYVGYSLSAVLYNVGIIGGIILFHEQAGIYSAAYGVVIGVFLHLGVRLLDMPHVGFHYRPLFFWKHPGFLTIVRLMIPRSLGLFAWQINLWSYAIIGYGLAAGSIAAFHYARNIQSFSVSLFGIALATAVFPFLSDLRAQGKFDHFEKRLLTTGRQMLYVTLPAALGLSLVSEDVVRAILVGGAFGEESVQVTSMLLMIFAWSIPFESLTHLFSRAYYSYQNTWTPVLIGILFTILNVLGAVLLTQYYGVPAFALSFVGSSLIQIVLLLSFFHRRFLAFSVSGLFSGMWKYLLSLVGLATIVLGISFFGEALTPLVRLILSVLLGALGYVGISLLLRCEEVVVLRPLMKKFFPFLRF